MTLRKRIDHLAAKHSRSRGSEPSTVLLREADGGTCEALFMGGGELSCKLGETEAEFIERATKGVAISVSLPADAREALAHPETPQWVKGPLVLRALVQKHPF